jgi:hypothetical protein
MPNISYWNLLAGDGAFSLSLTLRYMLRSQAPILLADRYSIAIAFDF